MNRPNLRTLMGALLMASALAVAGCADLVTGPDRADEPQYARGGSRGRNTTTTETTTTTTSSTVTSDDLVVVDSEQATVTAIVAHWKEPLLSDEVLTEVVGKRGGMLRLRQAGLVVVIPPGALKEDTQITLTAPAGELVGYEFEPHGLVFREPVELVQIWGRIADPPEDGGFGAYHEDPLAPEVEALEIFRISLEDGEGSFFIDHFSGYVIATGRFSRERSYDEM